jgi:hypothetical protein
MEWLLEENGMDPTLGYRKSSKRSARILSQALLLWVLSLPSTGCVFDKFFAPDTGIKPIETQLTQAALIEHLNQNIQGLYSWSCAEATISTRPSRFLPVKLTLAAQIAVERDKNFRLRASSPMGDEADFGSNDERFWFWMRRNQPPHVFTARHADMPAVSQRLQIPFEPAWIMEALGVVPLDPNSITLRQPGNSPHTVQLISHQVSPSGEQVRKEIVVDTRWGVILAHRLFDANGQRLAEARLSKHRKEPSGIIMPHVIELDWPQHQMAMTMELKNIEVNPSHLNDQIWQLPQDIPGSRVFDMGRRLNRMDAPMPHAPAGERTTQSETYLEPPPFAEHRNPPEWQPRGTINVRTAAEPDPEAPPFY